MELTKFNYDGHNITFEFADVGTMINATHLARPFGKLVGNFLKAQHAKDYIVLLEARYSKRNNGKEREVLRVVQGGTPELQGTWMDEKLALKFAAWLSPGFELWVYDRIHELLTTGKTQLQKQEESSVIKGLRMIVDQLAEQERQNEKFRVAIESQSERLDEVEAKILSIDESYYTISGYCSLNSIDCPLGKAKSWGYQATKASHAKGKAIGKAYDAKYGNVNTYHVDILKSIIK